ncbi:Ig-like domain-containing protein [Thermus sp. PS18]|uniref:Ig-like domain-containing protein n=1 Tax=Thermus sp. PS18 TaxID=2849039 RepID=UPI0022648043|nr:Ig-like domain-containing protein [Thermus sp. PS18]UZX16300.1 Ig-like domain-containing protein [Thermus sp. PS18]
MVSGALALILGACNTQNTSGDTGKSTVTVSVAFPQRQVSGSGLTPQGVPWSAAEADVKVYNNQGNLVKSATLTWQDPTASFILENGTYTFEVSVWSQQLVNNEPQRWKEVAWGQETHTITQNTNLPLKPKAILGNAWLSFSGNGIISPGEELNLRLLVVEPGGYSGDYFPLDDYNVNYEIGTCTQSDCSDFTPSNAATIEAQSKTGVRIKAGQVQQNTTIYVKAEVSGLGSDHQDTTLTRYSPPIQIPVSGNGVGIELDFNPPGVWLYNTSPSPGATVPVGQPVTFSGSASDGETQVKDLKVYVNSKEFPVTLSLPLPASSITFTFTFTPPTPGRYDIDIVAFDGAGNSYRYYTYVQAQ